MGPLSVKMKIQEDQAVIKEQREVLKMLNDEERKKKLHQMKLANELAKARQQELPIEKAIQDVRRDESKPTAASAPLGSGLASEARGHLANRGQRLQQEEDKAMGYNSGSNNVHPSDTVPAMLTPGEAVIPAPAAQHPANKPVIKALVEQGRAMNANQAPLGTGMADQARKALSGRQQQLDKKEREALGYKDGATTIPFSVETSGVVEPMISEEELARLSKIPASKLTADDAKKIAQVTSRVDRLSQNDVTYIPFGDAVKAEKMMAKEMDGARKDFSLKDNLAELEKEISKTSDPNVKSILTEELRALKGSNPAEVPNPARASRIGELQKAIAKSTDMAETNRLSAELEQLQGSNTFTIPKPEKFISEEATLRKLIENPGTDANTRGQARMRLQTLRSEKGAAEVPKMTREYGTAKALPGDVVTDPTIRVGTEKGRASMSDVMKEIPKPSQPVPTKSTAEMVAGVPAPVSNDGSAQHIAMLDNLLKDPVVADKLTKLEQTPPPAGATPEEQKSYLATGLSKIFDGSGMFNSEDLIRFALLAAGGMLTGGSVGGSIRYAGLHTLQASDQRRSAERSAAATAAQREADSRRSMLAADYTDKRELLQQREGQFNDLLKKIHPQSYKEAMQYYNTYLDKSKPFAEREHALRKATHVASLGQVEKDNSKDPKILAGKHPKTGADMDVMQAGDVRMVAPAGSGKWVPETPDNRAIDPSAYNKKKDDQRSAMEDKFTATLLSFNTKKGRNAGVYNKDYGAGDAAAQAKGLAQDMMGILEDLGQDADPKALATAAEITIQNLYEEFNGDPRGVSPEALRKTAYGTAVVALRPTNKELYQPVVPANDRTKNILGAESYTVITEKVKEGVKLSGGKLRADQVMEDIEGLYKDTIAAKPELKKAFENNARGKPGMSAFTFWLQNHYKPQ